MQRIIFSTILVVLCSVTLPVMAQNYTGAYGSYPHCETCHAGTGGPFDPWMNTAHSVAWDSISVIQWNPSCLPCHTTGWDTTLNNGGYDDYFYAGDTSGMMELRNVQCEQCHGPTEYPSYHPPAVDYSAENCGQCHTDDHHPTFDEWEESGHAVEAPVYAQSSSCAKCRETKTAILHLSGESEPEMPDTLNPIWKLPCATCHAPHSDSSYGAQYLRAEETEICIICHTNDGAEVGSTPHHCQREMFLGEGGYEYSGYTYSNSMHTTIISDRCITCHMFTMDYISADTIAIAGHTFEPDVRACEPCHGVIPDFNYDNVQTEIQELLDELNAALEAAQQSGDTTTQDYYRAFFNYNFVLNDKSLGVHNTEYAEALLESSIEHFVGVRSIPEAGIIPQEYFLSQNFPNPFNNQTVIELSVPEHTVMNLSIFDVSGRLVEEVFSGDINPGVYRFSFNGDGLSSGIYFYRFATDNVNLIRKMILVK